MHRRALNVFVLVEDLRRIHPELSAPLRGTRLWDVLARERIDVRQGRIAHPARSSGFDGDFLITLKRGIRPRDQWAWALHEFGHIRLGHLAGRGEHEKNLSPCMPDDPREDDANLFAILLYLGPAATPDTPRVARSIAKIEARRYRQRPTSRDDQMQLGIPAGVPMYKGPALPAGDGHGSYNPSAKWERRDPRKRFKGPRIKLGDSHDSLLFDWTKNGKPLGYFHLKRGWCDVWDTMPDSQRDGRREILVCGDRRAQWRDFVFSTTERYRYEFRDAEKRSRAPKDIDRQLEQAYRITMAAPISEATLHRARRGDGLGMKGDANDEDQ